MAQIKKIGDGKYLIRVSQGTGKSRRFINKVFRGTLKDARTYAREKETLLDLGYTPEEVTLTFSKALKKWLKVINKKLEISTVTTYREYIERYAEGSLGNLKLSEIKTHHIQSIYDGMGEKYSPTTVRNLHAPLKAMFNHFVKKESLRTNPCKNADLPALKKDEIIILEEHEIPVFMYHCQTIKNGLVFEFALETGMRPEEYLALRWRDVDFKRNSVSVAQAAAFDRNGGGYYFKPVKTKASLRSIDISEELRERLIQHKREQNDHRMNLRVSYAPLDLVFGSEIGTPYTLSNLRRRYFLPLLKKCGFIIEEEGDDGKKITTVVKNITLYSLRHTCATMLLREGESAKAVAKWLGHASVATTLDIYAHVTPAMQKNASAKLNNVLRLGLKK